MYELLTVSFILFVVVKFNWYVTCFSDRVAIKNNTAVIPVYDIYYSNIMVTQNQYAFYPIADYSIYIMIVLWIPVIQYYTLIHMLKVYALILLIRGLAIRSTIGYISMRKLNTNHMQKNGLNAGYSDLIISGHTVSAVLIYIHAASDWQLLIMNISMLMLCIFSVFTNLLVGDHYTSDIILGVAFAIITSHAISY